MIRTERLNIIPLPYMELVRHIAKHDGFIKNDEDEKKVYEYTVIPMLSEDDEQKHLFYTIWLAYNKGKVVVECGFLRPVNEHGVVEIWLDVIEGYREKGYGTEAVKGMVEWVKDKGVGFVGASIEPENKASQKVFLKNGFQYACDNQGMNIYFKTIK